jgi:acyl-CoA synthetase (AMP-forming)/AMP-acid ligase II
VDILTLIRQIAENQPECVAFCSLDSGDVLTYRELIQRADGIAKWLRQRGCRPGERCGLVAADGSEFLQSALGILSAGLCVAPIATSLPPNDKDRVINAARLQWLLQANRKLLRLPFAHAVDYRNDEDFRACNPAYIRFTSGTTGAGKCALLGHKAIVDRLDAANAVLRIGSEDTIWFGLPMADHFVVSILLYLSRGAKVVIASRPENWGLLAEKYRPTVVYGSPDFYHSLNRSRTFALGWVRLAICTTTPLSAEVAEEFCQRFGRNINPALGIIEVGLLTLNTSPRKIGSVGFPMPAYTISLVGENGEPVETNQVGELYVSGPGLLDAYLAPWRPIHRLLNDYGFATGDFARLDRDGYLFLEGRGRNRLRIDGIQFFCEEVESILNSLPGIQESRVYIDSKSNLLSAEIVGSPGPVERLPELLLGKIDERKVPKSFLLVDVLPRTANGKLRRL